MTSSDPELLALLIAETTDYAILTLDRDGCVASWNPGAERFKGYRADEIIGRHFSVFYPAEEIAAGKPERELKIAAADGRLEDEGWRIRKDGTRFWANVVITALHDADGRLRGFGKVTRDLTDRRARELELQASEAAAAIEIERADLNARLRAQADKDEHRLRQLLEGAPDATIIADTDGIIQTVNDQTLRVFGYTREELTGASIDQLVPEARRAGHARRRAVYASQPSTRAMGVERDLTARHKDGSEIPVSITLSPVHTDDGLLVIAAVRDITERYAEQARLQAAEEQFRRSFDDAPIGMTIIGLDGRYSAVNDAFCAIVGHSRAALIGLPRESISHPDDVAQGDESFRDLLAGKTRSVHEGEALSCTPSGTPSGRRSAPPSSATATAGRCTCISQVQDITERRQYENQLTHMADHDPLTGLLNRRSFERELDQPRRARQALRGRSARC